jgi:Holliday junction resolvasome RuvABC endonuclease subunit
MKYIGVDLSLNHTGLAIVDDTGAILVTHEIETDTKTSTWHRIIETIQKLSLFLEGENETCIEDVYFGLNARGAKDALRLSGALMYHYYCRCKKEPLLLMATSARKLVGLPGDCLKTDVQMFILQRFNMVPDARLKVYKKSVNAVNSGKDQLLIPLKEQLKNKHPRLGEVKEIKEKIDLVRKEYKKAMLKISKEIEVEFDLSEHKADALVLALAIKRYKEAQKELL